MLINPKAIERQRFVYEARMNEKSNVVELHPQTGQMTSISSRDLKCSPQVEQALRMYALGQTSVEQTAAACNMSKASLSKYINSGAGQHVIANVRGELEFRFQAQFKKVLDVLDQGLEHPDPSIALASANLWLKSNRVQNVKVEVTAEDLIHKIMNGGGDACGE